MENGTVDFIECELKKGPNACGFMLPENLQEITKHMKEHHLAGQPFTTCPFYLNGKRCMKKATDFRTLSRHLFFVHFGKLNSRKYVCHCGKEYTRPDALKRHRNDAHGL